MSKETFRRIYDWKARRARHTVHWKDYTRYGDAFAKLRDIPSTLDKVSLLVELPGIGVPVASAILHFLGPDAYPVIDVRTVGVLTSAGLLGGSRKPGGYRSSPEGYVLFTRAIVRIKEGHPGWTLREIDRALFAYHREVLSKKGGKTGRVRQGTSKRPSDPHLRVRPKTSHSADFRSSKWHATRSNT